MTTHKTDDIKTWVEASQATWVRIAIEAGHSILRIYDRGQLAVESSTSFKADDSPLTEADLASHKTIVAALRKFDVSIPVVSEEDDDIRNTKDNGSMFWLIDPLDGTKEFIARNGEFTVNIALIVEGNPIWGVVHAPALGLTYWGGSKFKSFKQISDNKTSQQSSLIQVSQRISGVPVTRAQTDTDLARYTFRVVASKSHLNAETASFIERLGDVALVQAGSSLKFCRIAEGSADVYPRLAPTCEWDTAAAQAVLEGAGGFVFQPDGEPLRYGKDDVLNPFFIASALNYAGLERLMTS